MYLFCYVTLFVIAFYFILYYLFLIACKICFLFFLLFSYCILFPYLNYFHIAFYFLIFFSYFIFALHCIFLMSYFILLLYFLFFPFFFSFHVVFFVIFFVILHFHLVFLFDFLIVFYSASCSLLSGSIFKCPLYNTMTGSVNNKLHGLTKLGKDAHVGSSPCSELCVLARRLSIHYLCHSTLIHVFGCGSILPDWTKKGNWADFRQSVTHPSEAFGTLACLALPKLWVFKSESKVISLAEYSKRLCLSILVITSAGVYHNVCESCFNTESMPS